MFFSRESFIRYSPVLVVTELVVNGTKRTNFQPQRTEEGRLEERLGAAEPLVADGDDLSVGELVALLEGG